MDTFEARHAQVDPDPVVELERRMQPWASAPPSRDVQLNAQIVPVQTIQSAIAELREWRRVGAKLIERAPPTDKPTNE